MGERVGGNEDTPSRREIDPVEPHAAWGEVPDARIIGVEPVGVGRQLPVVGFVHRLRGLQVPDDDGAGRDDFACHAPEAGRRHEDVIGGARVEEVAIINKNLSLDAEYLVVSEHGGELVDRPDVAPGSHRVTLHDLVKHTGPNRFAPEKGDRTQYLWHFRLSDDPDASEGTFIWYSGTNLRSKNLVAVLAALGVPATGFTKLTVLGKECLGQVDLNDRGYAKLINVVGIPK